MVGGVKAQSDFPMTNLGAVVFRQHKLRADALLGSKEPRIALEIAVLVVSNPEQGEALPDLGPIEFFVRDAVPARGGQRIRAGTTAGFSRVAG